MPVARSQAIHQTYRNPVYGHSFPDPFVLKHRGVYYAFCTGDAADGRVIGRLRSNDLVSWQPIDGAMRPLETGAPYYWAPEVTYYNGTFYMYYSVGNEALMEIRLATASAPDGDFVDAGVNLTDQEFAIDPHVFRDTDGDWYMFYATDFLDHTHVGTGTVVDRMIDPYRLAGTPRPVTRARYDWQVYDPERKEKGGVRWHTVEGPFVLKRKGLYYEMFSGGNWQNVSYGVSFAVTDDIGRDGEWAQYSDGEKTLPVLRTIPDRIIGPGHNSVVRGPNGRELYCIYHEWADAGRVLAIDRMDMSGGGRIYVAGPTHTDQPAPYLPVYLDRPVMGDWSVNGGDLTASADGKCVAATELSSESFLFEVDVSAAGMAGEFGVSIAAADGVVTARFVISIESSTVLLETADRVIASHRMTSGFDLAAFHNIRVDVNGLSAVFKLDDVEMSCATPLLAPSTSLSLFSNGAAATFSAAALTPGFEELFDADGLEERGWRFIGEALVEDKLVKLTSRVSEPAAIARQTGGGDVDLAVNLCLIELFAPEASATIDLAGVRMTVSRRGEQWTMGTSSVQLTLPDGVDPFIFHQYRFVLRSDLIEAYLESSMLGTFPMDRIGDEICIEARKCSIALDMVRLTYIL